MIQDYFCDTQSFFCINFYTMYNIVFVYHDYYERKPSYILMKKKVITKLCMSPRTHATTKQGKEKKTMPYKWAWQGKVQLFYITIIGAYVHQTIVTV